MPKKNKIKSKKEREVVSSSESASSASALRAAGGAGGGAEEALVPRAFAEPQESAIALILEELKKEYGPNNWLPDLAVIPDYTTELQRLRQKRGIAEFLTSGTTLNGLDFYNTFTISFLSESVSVGTAGASGKAFKTHVHALSLLGYALAVPGELDFFKAVLDKTDELPEDVGYYLNYALTCWLPESDEKLKLFIEKFDEPSHTVLRVLWTENTIDMLGQNLFLRAAGIGRFSWIHTMEAFLSPAELSISIPDLEPASVEESSRRPVMLNALDLALRRAQQELLSSSEYLGEALLSLKFRSAMESISFLIFKGLVPLEAVRTQATPLWINPEDFVSLGRLADLEKQIQVQIKENDEMSAKYLGEIHKLCASLAALSAGRDLVSSGDQKQVKKLQKDLLEKDKFLTQTQAKLSESQRLLDREKIQREASEVRVSRLEAELAKTKKELEISRQDAGSVRKDLLQLEGENKKLRASIQALQEQVKFLQNKLALKTDSGSASLSAAQSRSALVMASSFSPVVVPVPREGLLGKKQSPVDYSTTRSKSRFEFASESEEGAVSADRDSSEDFSFDLGD